MTEAELDEINAGFDEVRDLWLRKAWSAAEVLARFERLRAETLLACGALLCPPLPPEHFHIPAGTRWPLAGPHKPPSSSSPS